MSFRWMIFFEERRSRLFFQNISALFFQRRLLYYDFFDCNWFGFNWLLLLTYITKDCLYLNKNEVLEAQETFWNFWFFGTINEHNAIVHWTMPLLIFPDLIVIGIRICSAFLKNGQKILKMCVFECCSIFF